ncbi:hypothetical protein [Thermosediminibacter oceani]|uniref:Uncharacterized protein n=1 Tax=Thermosediminibacter oceani (strain ATCC BAA-1034 / DSM 16646 / JW/IW-1228P) TaxID=555079 RepID=D9S1C0_THEOJ|nr:hypothetical protein [Thermosediminibacter oceani]ADL07197.1 hypothetical protein Toce_0418 [Thermosediminibacter oceani DSM 16646]
MKGHQMDYELSYILWRGIHDALEKAIERRDKKAVEPLKRAVEYYNKHFVTSGKYLEDLLSKLESLKGGN